MATDTARLSSVRPLARSTQARLLVPWWLLLIAGGAWMLVGLLVLRFDYASVFSISLLFGFVALAAGIDELGQTLLANGWWKLLNALLATVFIAAGVVSFIHPGNTFVALAAVFSFLLVFAGAFDIVKALSARREIDFWWVQLIGGIVELALGLWAAGYSSRSATLLIVWVAAFAVIRGVTDIIRAFQIDAIKNRVDEASS